MIKKILVIGGTGYIGTPLVKKLKNEGYDLTLLVRGKKDFRDEFAGCQYFVADLSDKEALQNNIKNFDLVINLAAVIRALDKKKYQENVFGMENLIKAMRGNGINKLASSGFAGTKLLYFSTQNVNLKNKGPYAKSKAEAEKLLIASDLEYMIIRPNYVYSIDIRNDFYRLARIAKKFGVIPMIGKGKNKIEPVFKDDLVNITAGFVKDFRPKSIVEISGSESISIEEITNITRECLRKKCRIIRVPVLPLQLFKNFIPFDMDGYTEDRISQDPFSGYKFSSFKSDLKRIVELAK